ncbi:MAG: HAD-IC family P-type ATPase [Coleofasciculaceae cyanobacterium]
MSSGEKIKQHPDLAGLTEQQVRDRLVAGQGNDAKLETSRSYRQILQENLFNFINAVFAGIGIVMLLLGRIGDAILVVVIIFGGVLINIYQEIWAKQKLDEIALLHRPTATVIRHSQEHHIDPSGIVLDDILQVEPGDQIVVDGIIVGNGQIEVDESLLTGESDLIAKQAGDKVYSGSFCVSGTACYEAQKVGIHTVAYQLMTGARTFRQVLTPIQKEINLVIRIFMLIACFLWILVGISFLSKDYSITDVAQRSAVIAGLVPAGLLLAITLAYGLGAVRMLGQDVLIQQANAVESLSNVNILCLDKTGTLTSNQIQLQDLYPNKISSSQLQSLLSDYAASTTAGNKTNEAIAKLYPGQPYPLKAQVPFSSARKWSALAFDSVQSINLKAGVYLLGAPEILINNLSLSDPISEYIKTGTEQGLRVVAFVYSPHLEALHDQAGQPQLPPNIEILGILRFSDQLRPEAKETLDGFAQAGIAIKVISGDNPQTVASLAKQAGLGTEIQVVSGQELAQMDQAQFAQAAQNSTIFGRITPEQKAKLVQSLRQQGNYVAMIGDGVNDVLSLKQANLAIAMESGSKATRAVADIVLLKDSFGALPHTFSEGQRIRNGILDLMKLFMVRTACVTLLIFATAIVTDSFPLENKQSAFISLIGVGLPTMCIPIWAKPGAKLRYSLVRSLLHFVVPATLSLTMVSLLVYLFYLVVAVLDLPPGMGIAQVDYSVPRSALVAIFVMCELCLIPFLKPPTRAWVGGEPLSGDWRYTQTSLLLLGVYIIVVLVPPLRNFFELSSLSLMSYLFIGLVAIEWCLILRFIWRTRFLDRFLGVDLS